MLFNSAYYSLFFPLVFVVYWLLKEKARQNFFLLLASYWFYGSWDWRFLLLLATSTFLDFFFGKQIGGSLVQQERKVWLILSILMNLGILGIFKYFNFFSDAFAELLGILGLSASPFTLQVMLPIGISFYTFHGLSYVFDIYRSKTVVENNFVDYSLFVAYFPLLVAGPIERATHLLPQLKQQRRFDFVTASNGLRQILWGFFKKIVVADTCAIYVNQVFDGPDDVAGSTIIVGTLLFAVQIYGDFSGYSDIALGCSRLFGIELLRNFAFPYFSRNMAEFWKRWHISLSSWFRDYLYFPLGGSKGSLLVTARNVLIVFVVSGFWHGANWTFLFWGLLNGLYVLPFVLTDKGRHDGSHVAEGRILPTWKELAQMASTFAFTGIAWIFFRSHSIHQGFTMVSRVFSESILSRPDFKGIWGIIPLGILIVVLFVTEWGYRDKEFAFQDMQNRSPLSVRWSVYLLLVISMGLFMQESGTPFIYFQF